MTQWASKPWKDIDLAKTKLDDLPAYLTTDERKLFVWIAENLYCGSGEIVDAGAFLGGSASCFSEGLRRNGVVTQKAGRIHSFDLFRLFGDRPVDVLSEHKRGESFLNIYHDSLGQLLENYVTIYPGDITKRCWNSGPIEILMLDCLKDHTLSDQCIQLFYPHLRQGSLVVHQDYNNAQRLYWIHTHMYMLRDCFEYLGECQRGGSVVFNTVSVPSLAQIKDIIDEIRAGSWQEIALEAAKFMSSHSSRAENAIKETIKNYEMVPLPSKALGV